MAPLHGKEIASGSGEREKWEDLHIPSRTLAAMRRLNPQVPEQYLQQALAEAIDLLGRIDEVKRLAGLVGG